RHREHVRGEVREHRPVVTVDASYLLEPIHTANLVGRHCGGVTTHVAIERGVRGDESALKGGQRPPEVAVIDGCASAEGPSKHAAVVPVAVQSREDGGE